MALIPRAASVSRVIDDGQAPVASIDARNVGTGLQHLAVAADKVRDSRVRYQYAQAASDFLVKKTQQDNGYNDDQEYETILPRYREATTKALEESAALIKDPTVRNEFLLNFRPQVAAGEARITDIARGRERDYQRGYLQQQLNTMTETGLTGDIPEAINTASALLLTARDQGYVSAQEYETMQQQFRTSLAERAIGMLEPDGVMKALDEAWAHNLPADTRLRFRRDAQQELDRRAKEARILEIKTQATERADQALLHLQAGVASYEDVTANLATIEDVELRDEATRRFESGVARMERDQAEQQDTLYNEYFTKVRSGTGPDGQPFSVDDIPAADLARMEPRVIQSLEAAQEQYAARGNTYPTVSDRQALIELQGAAAAAKAGRLPQSEYRAKFMEVSPRLNATDFDQYNVDSSALPTPPEVKSYISTSALVTQKLKPLAEDNDALFNQMKDNFDTWYMQVQQATGKPPSDVEVRRQLDLVILDRFSIEDDEDFIPFSEVEWGNASPSQRATELARIRATEPTVVADIEARLPPGFTDEEFMLEYLRSRPLEE